MNKEIKLFDTPEDSNPQVNTIYGASGKYVHPQLWGNNFIKENIKNHKAFSAGKLGGIECSAMQEYLLMGEKSNWNKPMWWSTLASAMHNNAGIFPETPKFINIWAKIFSESLIDIDLLGVWSPQFQEDSIIRHFAPFSNICATRALEPFYHADPWTSALEGKKVLVISPFTETIKTQYGRKDLIWGNLEGQINPDFEISFVKCPLSPALQKPVDQTWEKSLNRMQNEIKNIDFDIALIGSGAYSLPLCSFIRNMNKSAIHLGGGLQIVFGVLGRRWLDHKIISNFFNEHWVFPSDAETPNGTHIIEGSCYWR